MGHFIERGSDELRRQQHRRLCGRQQSTAEHRVQVAMIDEVRRAARGGPARCRLLPAEHAARMNEKGELWSILHRLSPAHGQA